MTSPSHELIQLISASSQSDFVALKSQQTLGSQMANLLSSNRALAETVKNLSDAFSISTSTTRAPQRASHKVDDEENATGLLRNDNASVEFVCMPDNHHPSKTPPTVLQFTRDLASSRVYTRVKRSEGLFTISTSALESAA